MDDVLQVEPNKPVTGTTGPSAARFLQVSFGTRAA